MAQDYPNNGLNLEEEAPEEEDFFAKIEKLNA